MAHSDFCGYAVRSIVLAALLPFLVLLLIASHSTGTGKMRLFTRRAAAPLDNGTAAGRGDADSSSSARGRNEGRTGKETTPTDERSRRINLMDLPLEILERIAEYAWADDDETRQSRTKNGQQLAAEDNEGAASSGEPVSTSSLCVSGTQSSGSSGVTSTEVCHERTGSDITSRRSEHRRAGSALCFSRTCTKAMNATIPVIWRVSIVLCPASVRGRLAKQDFFGLDVPPLNLNPDSASRDQSLDLTAVPVHMHQSIADQLDGQRGRGRYVRKLQLSVVIAGSAQDIRLAQGRGAMKAVTPAMATRILQSLSHLRWLELEFLALDTSSYYVSRLPEALAKAISRCGPSLRHFGISCNDVRMNSIQSVHPDPLLPANTDEHTAIAPQPQTEHEYSHISFQLDEGLVARLLRKLPNLRSLTLHRVGHDTIGAVSSPLCEAVASLKFLRSLNMLEVHAFNELWEPMLAGNVLRDDQADFSLLDLTIICCSRATSATIDAMLQRYSSSLKNLFLVHTPLSTMATATRSDLETSRLNSAPSRSSTFKYDLPALESVHLEASAVSELESALWLERLAATPVRKISLYKLVQAASVNRLASLIASRQRSKTNFGQLQQVEVSRVGRREAASNNRRQMNEVVAADNRRLRHTLLQAGIDTGVAVRIGATAPLSA